MITRTCPTSILWVCSVKVSGAGPKFLMLRIKNILTLFLGEMKERDDESDDDFKLEFDPYKDPTTVSANEEMKNSKI